MTGLNSTEPKKAPEGTPVGYVRHEFSGRIAPIVGSQATAHRLSATTRRNARARPTSSRWWLGRSRETNGVTPIQHVTRVVKLESTPRHFVAREPLVGSPSKTYRSIYQYNCMIWKIICRGGPKRATWLLDRI